MNQSSAVQKQTTVLHSLPAIRRGARASKADIDAYVRELSVEIAAHAPPRLPTILIGGYMRCGKTILAQRLSEQYGLYHLRTDFVRKAVYRKLDSKTKRRVAKYLYKKIILTHPCGLIVEGDAMMRLASFLTTWAPARGIPFFGVGYSFDRPEEKHQHLLEFRAKGDCWTAGKHSDEGMQKIARDIISRSKDLKKLCHKLGRPYFDLDSASFDIEVERISSQIGMAAFSASAAATPEA